MRRNMLQDGLIAGALMLAIGTAIAQNAPAASGSVPARTSPMTPALPTLVPSQTQTVPAAPANQPPATLQPDQSLTNPLAGPSTSPAYGQGAGGSYGGPSYGRPAGGPMTAGTGQPIVDARSLTRGDNAPTAFRALDPMNRGYVTREDADKLDGFIGWFDNADTDRDGRLTPEEFQNAWKSYAR